VTGAELTRVERPHHRFRSGWALRTVFPWPRHAVRRTPARRDSKHGARLFSVPPASVFDAHSIAFRLLAWSVSTHRSAPLGARRASVFQTPHPSFGGVRTSGTNHHVLQRRRFAFRTRRLSTEQGPHFEPLCLSAQGSISNPAAPFGTPSPDRWPSTFLAPTDRTSEARTPFGVRGTPHSRRNQHAFGVPLGAESRPIAAFRAVTGEASLCGRRQGRRAGQP
jgi:hypothetical protein